MKIGLLASTYVSEFRLRTIFPILKDRRFNIDCVIIDKRPKRTYMQKFKRNFRRCGFYTIIMIIEHLLTRKNKKYSTKDFFMKENVRILESKDPYSNKTIDFIKKSNLDILILLGGYGIIKKPLFNLTKYGILSYHHGDMRKYRGMPPGFWELYYDEDEVGITVQIIDIGLDCGLPIEEKKIRIKNLNFNWYQLKNVLMKESESMMYNALIKLNDPLFKPKKIEEFGNIFTLPNLRQWLSLMIRNFSKKKMTRLHSYRKADEIS